jgi:hypothetical protein
MENEKKLTLWTVLWVLLLGWFFKKSTSKFFKSLWAGLIVYTLYPIVRGVLSGGYPDWDKIQKENLVMSFLPALYILWDDIAKWFGIDSENIKSKVTNFIKELKS